MPYARRYRKGPRKGYRKSARKTKSYAKKSTKMAKSVNLRRDIHYFKRHVNYYTISSGGGYGHYFALNQLPNVSEFTSLFDQYQLVKVNLRFKLRIDPGAGSTLGTYPTMLYRRDHDDANPPGSIDEMEQSNLTRHVVLHPNKWIKIGVKPSILQAGYTQTGVTATFPKYKTWIDVSYPDVKHYGLKTFVDILPTGQYVDVYADFIFMCKDTR